ncbi:MAG: flagellar hook-length control protein FliK, partial [Epsilonproteobacteria bacterium]|nr:flagellar hook-length control protein FliK [Campylobacterota bacterium]
ELTTQQFVSVKLSKEVQKEAGKTADFSVATARVLASSAKTEQQKNLELLLHGESMSDDVAKSDASLHLKSAESFEVKLGEAKQMIKYLSHDIKQAIEDYKAPFTRVKVQLNPQNLGEVDLTVVQRGKNLHINLSSNNAAINALAMNANDLKVQLQNNGIQNASLNFNTSSQGEQNGGGSHPHQQRQDNQKGSNEYGYFETEEQNQELQNSLEIVVPYYA